MRVIEGDKPGSSRMTNRRTPSSGWFLGKPKNKYVRIKDVCPLKIRRCCENGDKLMSTEQEAISTTTSIHPGTHLGLVTLRVADLERSRRFWEGILSFQP